MKRLPLFVLCSLLLIGLVQAKDTPPSAVQPTAGAAAKEASTNTVGQAMTEAAQKFLASLNADELAKVSIKFDDPRRLDWHNIPKPERKGLQLHDMTAEQQQLAHGLVRAALSDTGYAKAARIMSLENNLREGEKNLKGGALRDPLRYFLTIFGKPEMTGVWGWSFEGHHLSLNFVIRDGQVVADTPSFFGANPATLRLFVPGGPKEGTRTLAQEEQLAFDLVNDLSDAQRKTAIIAEKAPDDYRNAGVPQPPHTPPVGLPAAEMTEGQKKILWSLLEAYNGNMAPPIAAARLADIKAIGLDHVYFAWAGGTKPGTGHYYRVQGPGFVLELVNIQSDPAGNPANHIHSVWRNLKGDFGVMSN
jgi:hypothetical protein